MNRIEENSLVLIWGGRRLEPVSREKNMVGFCSRCEADLYSIAYHNIDDRWLVSAGCNNGHLFLLQYDRQWRWLQDGDLEIKKEEVRICDIAREKLETVFTAAEIRDLAACQEGQPYTRQNLYRARAKYEKFERLFGIKIDL
ncbi:MAG: hypothetical protein ACP5PV_06935 [Methanothrix sp.]